MNKRGLKADPWCNPVIMSTENYGLAVASSQVYYGITKQPNITFRKPIIRVKFTSIS